jgi:hypothetical protein
MKATATGFVFECSGWTQLVIEVVTEAIESVGVKPTLHNVFNNEVSFAIDKNPDYFIIVELHDSGENDYILHEEIWEEWEEDGELIRVPYGEEVYRTQSLKDFLQHIKTRF